jgi:hypothetical protein
MKMNPLNYKRGTFHLYESMYIFKAHVNRNKKKFPCQVATCHQLVNSKPKSSSLQVHDTL